MASIHLRKVRTTPYSPLAASIEPTTHYQMLHLYPETRPEQTPFDSSFPQSFEQDREKQPQWICLSGIMSGAKWDCIGVFLVYLFAL
jgi:hypothetical protein